MATIARMSIELGADITRLQRSMRQGTRDVQMFAESAERIGDNMRSIGTRMSLGLTLPLLALGTGAITAANSFDLAMTGVAKTVDATAAEIAAMGEEFKAMSETMPTSANELAGVAEAAGQLGIRASDIVSFTKVMADLGVSTNLTAEDAAVSIARIANVTGMAMTDVERFGSTLVALGNAGASTEREILDMATRIASTGNIVGLAEHEILAFANALSSVGIESEAGGTAISRVFVDMAKAADQGGRQLELFSAVAGTTAQEFARRFETDAAGAMVSFIEGLSQLEAKGVSAFEVLSEMGLDDIRVQNALLAAAGASEFFAQSLEDGAAAWEQNNALAAEAERFYAANANQLKALWNMIVNVSGELGTALMPAFVSFLKAMRPVIGFLRTLIEWFSGLPAPMQAVGFAFVGILAAAGPVILLIGSMIPIVTGLGVGFAALAAPVAAAIAAFLAIVAAVTAVIDNWQILSYEAGRFIDVIKENLTAIGTLIAVLAAPFVGPPVAAFIALAAAGTAIIDNWNVIKYEATRLWDIIRNLFRSGIDRVTGMVRGFADSVIAPFARMYDVLVGHSIVPDLIARIRGEFSQMREIMVPPVEIAITEVIQQFDNAIDAIRHRMERMHRLSSEARARIARDFEIGILQGMVAPVAMPSAPRSESDHVRQMIEAAQAAGESFEMLDAQTQALFVAWAEQDRELRRSWQEALAERGPGLGERAAEGTMELFQSMGMQLLAAINPLSLFASVVDQVARNLAPTFDILAEPLGRIAQVVSSALAPIFEALAPILEGLLPLFDAFFSVLSPILAALMPLFEAFIPILEALFPLFKFLAIVTTYVAEVFGRITAPILDVVGTFVRGIGWAVRGIGRLINKLPGSLGDPLVAAGQSAIDAGRAMNDMADGMREMADGMAGARDTIQDIEIDRTNSGLQELGDTARQVANALRNVPAGYRIALRRFEATDLRDTGGTGGGSGDTGGGGRPPGKFDQQMSITLAPGAIVVQGAGDPAVVAQEVVNELKRKARAQLGNSTRWAEVQ